MSLLTKSREAVGAALRSAVVWSGLLADYDARLEKLERQAVFATPLPDLLSKDEATREAIRAAMLGLYLGGSDLRYALRDVVQALSPEIRQFMRDEGEEVAYHRLFPDPDDNAATDPENSEEDTADG